MSIDLTKVLSPDVSVSDTQTNDGGVVRVTFAFAPADSFAAALGDCARVNRASAARNEDPRGKDLWSNSLASISLTGLPSNRNGPTFFSSTGHVDSYYGGYIRYRLTSLSRWLSRKIYGQFTIGDFSPAQNAASRCRKIKLGVKNHGGIITNHND